MSGKSSNFSPGNFTNAEDMPRQVDALARAVQDAFLRLPNIFMPVLSPTKPTKFPVTGFKARAGDLITVEASTTSRSLVLPSALAGVASVVGIVATDLTNDVTVTSDGKAGTVNGVTGFILPFANRLYLFVSDGVRGWWSTS